jgi:hypothetical protein
MPKDSPTQTSSSEIFVRVASKREQELHISYPVPIPFRPSICTLRRWKHGCRNFSKYAECCIWLGELSFVDMPLEIGSLCKIKMDNKRTEC